MEVCLLRICHLCGIDLAEAKCLCAECRQRHAEARWMTFTAQQQLA